jgi:hypothetical protein
MLFPNGNRSPETISAFLECIPDAAGKEEISPKWHVCAFFGITVHNADHEEVSSPLSSNIRSKLIARCSASVYRQGKRLGVLCIIYSCKSDQSSRGV